MSDQPKLVIVDTNCYVRLYYSRLRPILGQAVGGYHLVTLHELADEARDGTGLVERNAWLLAADVQRDIHGAVMSLTVEQRSEYTTLAKFYRDEGDGILHAHCTEKAIRVRSLSLADATALTIALDLDAILATDEWPLRLVASTMAVDDDARAELFSSLDLLWLLEAEEKISREDRKTVVREWLQAGEGLLNTWRDDYRRIFSEGPPTVQ